MPVPKPSKFQIDLVDNFHFLLVSIIKKDLPASFSTLFPFKLVLKVKKEKKKKTLMFIIFYENVVY